MGSWFLFTSILAFPLYGISSSVDYRYAGYQLGSYCFCGNDGYDMYGPGTGCTSLCPFDNTMTCGGGWRNEVYRLPRVNEMAPYPGM